MKNEVDNMESVFVALMKLKTFIMEAIRAGKRFDHQIKCLWMDEKLMYGITLITLEVRDGKMGNIQPATFIIEAEKINRVMAIIFKLLKHGDSLVTLQGGNNGPSPLITKTH